MTNDDSQKFRVLKFPLVHPDEIPERLRLRTEEILRLLCVNDADVVVTLSRKEQALTLKISCSEIDHKSFDSERAELFESLRHVIESLASRHGFRATVEMDPRIVPF